MSKECEGIARMRKIQEALLVSKKICMVDTAMYLLMDIMTSLPEDRDWLNPETERIANQVIGEYRELQASSTQDK